MAFFNVYHFVDTTRSTTLEIIYRDTNNNNNTEEMINAELNNINEWLNINKLALNTGKCKYMIFHTQQKKINPLY